MKTAFSFYVLLAAQFPDSSAGPDSGGSHLALIPQPWITALETFYLEHDQVILLTIVVLAFVLLYVAIKLTDAVFSVFAEELVRVLRRQGRDRQELRQSRFLGRVLSRLDPKRLPRTSARPRLHLPMSLPRLNGEERGAKDRPCQASDETPPDEDRA